MAQKKIDVKTGCNRSFNNSKNRVINKRITLKSVTQIGYLMFVIPKCLSNIYEYKISVKTQPFII